MRTEQEKIQKCLILSYGVIFIVSWTKLNPPLGSWIDDHGSIPFFHWVVRKRKIWASCWTILHTYDIVWVTSKIRLDVIKLPFQSRVAKKELANLNSYVSLIYLGFADVIWFVIVVFVNFLWKCYWCLIWYPQQYKYLKILHCLKVILTGSFLGATHI